MENESKIFEIFGNEEQIIKIKAEDILNAIIQEKNINIQYANIEGDLDIGKISKNLKTDDDGKLIIYGKVNILKSKFSGDINCSDTRFSLNSCFIDVIFSGDVDFGGAVFAENISFGNSKFSRNASFIKSCFSGGAYFGETVFTSFSNFDKAVFSNDATFSDIKFFGNTSFINANFGGNINFAKSQFMGNVSFIETIFSGKASFNSANFEGYANFINSRFIGETKFNSASFGKGISFEKARTEYPINFKNVFYVENTLLNRFRKQKPTSFLDINTTIMDASTNPYLKRYIDDEQWINSWRANGKVRKYLYYIWAITSYCGRNFVLWLGWEILIAILFGLIYANYGCFSWLPDSICPEFHTSMIKTAFTPYYLSIIAFTTLGFGNISPMNMAGEIFLAIEVFLGYIMLGVLLSIFANKLARRS